MIFFLHEVPCLTYPSEGSQALQTFYSSQDKQPSGHSYSLTFYFYSSFYVFCIKIKKIENNKRESMLILTDYYFKTIKSSFYFLLIIFNIYKSKL